MVIKKPQGSAYITVPGGKGFKPGRCGSQIGIRGALTDELAVALAKGKMLSEHMRWGAGVAAISPTQQGILPSMPH